MSMHRRCWQRARTGFSLMEVLIAMGIFAVGFVLIASIFPVGAQLQRQATTALLSKQAVRNTKALLEGRTLQASDLITNLPAGYDSNQQVYPFPTAVLAQWAINDRSFPSKTTDYRERSFYWVPLVRDKNASASTAILDWEIYVFVLKREEQGVYTKPTPLPDSRDAWANPSDDQYVPGVRSVQVAISATDGTRFDFTSASFTNDSDSDGTMEQIQAGDWILDNFGTIYRVDSADATGFTVTSYITANPDTGSTPTAIWYSPPHAQGRDGPAKEIILLTEVVQ